MSDTKPSAEQIEAAKWITRHFLGDDIPADEHMDAKLLSFLAQREASLTSQLGEARGAFKAKDKILNDLIDSAMNGDFIGQKVFIRRLQEVVNLTPAIDAAMRATEKP